MVMMSNRSIEAMHSILMICWLLVLKNIIIGIILMNASSNESFQIIIR